MDRRALFKAFSEILPFACAGAAALVVICDVVAINLNPTYNPLRQSISDLVLYPWGWLEEVGMAASGLAQGLIAAAVLSSPAARLNPGLRLAGALFAAIAAGFVIIITFNTDPGLAIATVGGGIHVVTVITIAILFPIACLLLARTMRTHPESNAIEHFSIIMAVISLVVAWQVLPFNHIDLVGVSERLLAGVNLAWIVFAGSHIPELVGASHPETAHNGMIFFRNRSNRRDG